MIESLACAVINQAYRDLTSKSKNVGSKHRESAREFLSFQNEQFLFWCYVAGIDARQVIATVNKHY